MTTTANIQTALAGLLGEEPLLPLLPGFWIAAGRRAA